jgi:hypothetical protein
LAFDARAWLDAAMVEIGIASPPPWLVHLVSRIRPSATSVLAVGKYALAWAAGRTGLPVVVIAALALVIGWRVARRTWHIAFELALALAVLLVATRLGWIRW